MSAFASIVSMKRDQGMRVEMAVGSQTLVVMLIKIRTRALVGLVRVYPPAQVFSKLREAII